MLAHPYRTTPGREPQRSRKADQPGARALIHRHHRMSAPPGRKLGALRTAGGAHRSAACDSTALRQSAPPPVLRLLQLGTPLPNLPAATPATIRAHRGRIHASSSKSLLPAVHSSGPVTSLTEPTTRHSVPAHNACTLPRELAGRSGQPPDTGKGPDQAIRPGQSPASRRAALYAGFCP